MIKQFIIIFMCFTTSVYAGVYQCQHYTFNEADNWLCAHLERDSFTSNSMLSKQTAIDDDNYKKIQVLLTEAEQFYEQGNYSEVEKNYRKVLKEYSQYASGWIKLAQLYSAMNRENDALQILHRAAETLMDNADVYHEMGLVQVRLRLFSRAVTSLAKAAVRAPENAHYSYVYAIALNSTQRPYKAIDVLLQAYGHHPYDMEILESLFSLYVDINKHHEALAVAKKILLIEPDNNPIQRYVLESSKK